jgi:hypothetical protein
MDNTHDRHAYMCFPITLTNGLGWGISFPEDISFIWDGVISSEPHHVTVLEGHDYVYTGRAHGTISFITGIVIRTDENTSILTMPVPNLFTEGAQCFTTVMSTSFYMPNFPLAWQITQANKKITIKAGTPVAAILPLSVGALNLEYEVNIKSEYLGDEYFQKVREYGKIASDKNSQSDWSKMYRDAVNHDGTSAGKHEVKSIRLKTNICPITGKTVDELN